MTFEEIINGINKSSCRPELDDSFARAVDAIESGNDMDDECLELILRAAKSKSIELNERIYH